MAQTKSVHVKMDPEFKKKVDQYCQDRGIGIGEAVRACLRDALTIAGFFDTPTASSRGVDESK